MYVCMDNSDTKIRIKTVVKSNAMEEKRRIADKKRERMEEMQRNSPEKLHWNTFEHESADSLVDTYSMSMMCYLGQSYTIRSYKEELRNRMPTYIQERIPNFYAIVMPGGHGKTWLSFQYGFIDVDSLVDDDVGVELYRMRDSYVFSNTKEWKKHNAMWYQMMNKTISMMTFDKPVLVLVHSEECALELGARVIGILTLENFQFEKNIQKRGRKARVFSAITKEFVESRSLRRVERFPDNEGLQARVIDLCNKYSIPVACPNKFRSKRWNDHYHRSTPRWLLEGNVQGRLGSLDYVMRLFERKWIPKECVDHFIRFNTNIGKAYGFGVTMNDWAVVLAKVAGAVRERTDFDKEGDMFDIFPPGSMAEKHRVNVTLKRLVSEFDIWSDEYVYEIGMRHVGERQVFVSGLVSHWLGIGRFLPIEASIFPFYLVTVDRWNKVMSEVHALIRVSNWYCTTPIDERTKQSVMYMNMLSGRKMYDADWKKVLAERENDGGTQYVSYDPVRCVWSRAQYLNDFNVALYEAYNGMFNDSVPADVENFAQFWKKRRTWVAKGSTVMNQLPKEMLTYNLDFISQLNDRIERVRMRHNKKSLFESNEILNLLNETVESWNATKAVPKLNETGKERELLPGTLMHYLVFSYVLYIAEKQRQIGSTRLNMNDDDNIINYDRKMMSGQHHMLYDWANFNAQHSKDDMARVIHMLKYIPGAPSDYGDYCDAIAESFYHMYLVDDDGEKHKLEKGLFSGWRGTTWINTVLNYVYVSIGIKCCQRLYKDMEINYVDHGGDDLDISFKKPSDCFHLLEVMDSIGFEATAIKQMIDTKAEFYRNTITTRGVFASPTRALANFVSGNWETGGAKTLTEKTTSILDQVWKLIRRGVDKEFCYRLAAISLKHWLKIKCDDEWVEVKKELLHGRVEDGGLGIPDIEGNVWVLDPPIHVTKDSGFAFKLPGAYCTEDYVDVIESELKGMNLQLVKRGGLIDKLAQQSYDLEKFEERAIFLELNKVVTKCADKVKVVGVRWNERIYEEFLKWGARGGEKLGLTRIERLSEFEGHIAIGDRILTKGDLVALYVNRRVTQDVIDFKGDVYYRRLVPDFLANMIDGFTRWYGNETGMGKDEMMEIFRTLCYMASTVYEHRA